MKYITSKADVDAYYTSPRIGQSKLKLLLKGVHEYNAVETEEEAEEKQYDEKAYFIIGSAVDCKLTSEPQVFDEVYHVSDCKKPSETVIPIIKRTLDELLRMDEGLPESLEELVRENPLDNALSRAIEYHGYYSNRKMSTNVINIVAECDEYFQHLISAVGKQVLSLQENDIVQKITESFKKHDAIRDFITDSEQIDVYFQLAIYFGDDFKSLLDVLRVDHKNKTIQVGDFKTMFDMPIKFVHSLKARRYDLQGAFYNIAVLNWIDKHHPELSSYHILNPAFLVETTKPGFQGNPIFYVLSHDLMTISQYGKRDYSARLIRKTPETEKKSYVETNKTIGIYELLDLYEWHKVNGFHKDKALLHSDKPMILDWEGIKDETASK